MSRAQLLTQDLSPNVQKCRFQLDHCGGPASSRTDCSVQPWGVRTTPFSEAAVKGPHGPSGGKRWGKGAAYGPVCVQRPPVSEVGRNVSQHSRAQALHAVLRGASFVQLGGFPREKKVSIRKQRGVYWPVGCIRLCPTETTEAASPCLGPAGRPAQNRTPKQPHPRTECRDLGQAQESAFHGLPADANTGAPRLPETQ